MTGLRYLPAVAPSGQDPAELARAVIALAQGLINAVGEVTLAPNAGSTPLIDARLHPYSFLALDPLSASAAAELAAGTVYAALADRGEGTWTLTHAADPAADRQFRYLVITG